MASPEEQEREFDKILMSVGDDGPYQKFLFWGFMFTFSTIIPFSALVQVFQISLPDHWCHVPGKPDRMPMDSWKNITIPWEEEKEGGGQTLSKCKQYVYADTIVYTLNTSDAYNTKYNSTEKWSIRNTTECQQGWDYDHTYYDSTLSMDEDWVCDRFSIVAVWLSVFPPGSLLGTLIFTNLGDKIGRKPTLILSTCFYIVFSTVRLYVTYTFTWIMVLTFLSSLPFPYLLQVTLVMVYEQVTSKWRERVIGVSFNAWIVGICILPLAAWLCRDWKLLGVVTTVPFIPFIGVFWYINETPRWLASKGHLAKAKRVLVDIAKKNGKQPPPDLDYRLQNLNYKKMGAAQESVIELLKHRNLRLRTLLLTCSTITNTTVYYGLILNLKNISGNEFLNFFYISIVEFPANMAGWKCAAIFGRRWSQVAAFMASALLCFAAMFVSADGVTVGLSVACKMVNCVSFIVLYLQEVEMFPTSHRSSGIGFTSCLTTVFAFGVPYIAFSAAIWSKMPFAILTLISLMGAITSSFLPETIGVSLPQTIEEGEKLVANQKFWTYFGWRPTSFKKYRSPSKGDFD